MLPEWFLPTVGSALGLGVYDICKKHAVRDNSVMPVLFLATLTGSTVFVIATAAFGRLAEAAICSLHVWWLLLAKAVLVGASWTTVYYALRELPISIAAPIRASAPLWTLIGAMILFQEIPSVWQAIGIAAIFIGYYFFSVLGKLEGIVFYQSKGIRLIFTGTLLGAASALYDKYLLGVCGISQLTVQFWFSVDLVFLLGAALLVRMFLFQRTHKFYWRWSIPWIGILLIAADALYFYALSTAEAQISLISLVRRSSCVVTFVAGVWIFHDVNVKRKAYALILILAGVLILGMAK